MLPRPRDGVRFARAAVQWAAIVLLGCLLLEAVLRLSGTHSPRLAATLQGYRRLWVHDATKGWFHSSLTTAAAGDAHGPEATWPMARTNSLGLRGAELRPAGPVSRRVAVVGDSFVFGHEVEEPRLLTSWLEKRLATADPAHDYQVINLGVHGYSTDQQLILVRELLPQLRPDLVLVVVCDNDFVQNTEDFAYNLYYKPYFETGPGGLVLRNVPVPRLTRLQQAKLWLARRSELWNFARSRRSNVAAQQRLLDVFQVGVPRRSGADPVDVTVALIRAMAEAAGDAGARFVATHTGRRGENKAQIDALEARLVDAHILWLRMDRPLDAARRAHPQLRWQFGHDSHWSEEAHRVAAGVVEEYLSAQGLVPVPPRSP